MSSNNGIHSEDMREHELLVLVSRTAMSEEAAARVRELAASVRWQRLLVVAVYHGVQALLYHHLKRLDVDSVPEKVMHHLRGLVGARSAHGLVLVHELGQLAKLFDAEGLRFIAVKGPTLANTIYGGIALRSFGDLDLVVGRKQYEAVESLLRREGYDSMSLQPFQKASYLFIHGQYTFWRRMPHMGSAAVVLDVHSAVMPPGYAYEEDFEGLFARAETVAMGGVEIPVFQREDLLLILCYHGFKNRWDRLKYFTDVAELIRASPDLDWDTVLARARGMDSERVLFLGLGLAHDLLGAPVPESVKQQVRRDARVARLAGDLIERLPRQVTMRVEPYFDRVRLNILAQDGLVGGLRYGAFAAVRRMAEFYTPENE